MKSKFILIVATICAVVAAPGLMWKNKNMPDSKSEEVIISAQPMNAAIIKNGDLFWWGLNYKNQLGEKKNK